MEDKKVNNEKEIVKIHFKLPKDFTLTDEMKKFIDSLENNDKPIYLTGKGGSGKSTLLKYAMNKTKKCFLLAASTGIAAVNIGGVTIHSLLNLPTTPIAPDQHVSAFKMKQSKMSVIKHCDGIIIDEVSMIRADLMDTINKVLKIIMKNTKPFGGKKMIFIGDLFQLPPVLGNDWKAVSSYYKSPYFFDSKVLQETDYEKIELTNVFRQKEQEFTDILNRMRVYNSTLADIKKINSRVIYNVDDYIANDKCVHLCSLRKEAKAFNEIRLGEPEFRCKAVISGDFQESAYPVDEELLLRVGARVMTKRNTEDYVNGSLGTIEAIDKDNGFVVVKLDTGKTIVVSPITWYNQSYSMGKDEETGEDIVQTENIGSFTQIPLQLAWAVTIHKSQGLTFDNIFIHSSKIFASGQLYVALSRCTKLEGVILDSEISLKTIKKDKDLLEFDKKLHNNKSNIKDIDLFSIMFKK